MAGDEVSPVEVARPLGGGRSRLAVLLTVSVLGVVVFVGASGRWNTPAPSLGPATQPPVATTTARSGGAGFELYVPVRYRDYRAGGYGIVVSWPVNGGVASVSASLEQVDLGVLSALYEVAMPDGPASVTIKLVQFGSATPQDDLTIGTWKTEIAFDQAAPLIDYTAAPAIDAFELPRLVRAGYHLEAKLTGESGLVTLGFTVNAGRVDVLNPGEIYEMRMTGEGYDIGGRMIQLDFGHVRGSQTWPADLPRQTQLELDLVDTATTDLAAPEVVGTWPVHVLAARHVPLSGIVILDETVAPHPGISELVAGGYHLMVTETIDANGIRLTCDVYASSTSRSTNPITTQPTR